MLALKEFANFINLNLANLATSYAQLLAESSESYAIIPADHRTSYARRLLKAVVEACETQKSTPLVRLFDHQNNKNFYHWTESPTSPLYEVECLGQTLTPVVTNLEAGKFLWQILAEIRALLASTPEDQHTSSEVFQVKTGQNIQTLPEEIANQPRLGQPIEEHDLLRQVIDQLPHHVYVKDAEGRFILGNKATAHSLGAATPADIIGKTDFDFSPHEVAAQYLADEQAIFQSGQSPIYSEELIHDHVTGEQRWVATTKTLIQDDQQKPVALVGINYDITKRKQLEQQIQESLAWRTQQIEISIAIVQEIALASTLDDLFRKAVNLIQTKFGYNHVHTYTLTDQAETDGKAAYLVMQASAGQVGHQMKEAGHKIALAAEQSPVARAARSGESVLISDSSLVPDWLPNPLLPETKSELAVPIKLSDTVLGVLDIQDDVVGGVSEEDQLLLQALCAQIAIVIENKRLLEETQQRTREWAVLNELGQTLAAHLNVEQVFDAIYQGTSRLLDTSNFSVGLYDPEKEEVTIAFTTNQSKLDRQITTMPANQGITGYIIRNRTSLLIPDNVSERLAELEIEAVGEPAQSFLGVPLIAGDQVLGRISVQSFTTPRAYDERDRELLVTVANQAAVALQNARQFEQMQRQARREQTIREITDKLRTAPNLERLVELATTELAQRFSATHAKLELGIDTAPAQHKNGNVLSSPNNDGH